VARYRGAGSLDQLVALFKDGATAGSEDKHGELAESETAVARNIPASIRTFTSDERRHAHAVEAGSTHVVEVRYRTDVTSKMWFKWGTRRLDINGPAVDQLNQRRRIEIPCKEIDRG